MKKYLMTGVAALALGATFVSCSHEEGYATIQEAKTAQYQAAFEKEFGSISPSQTWGFGSSAKAMTRGITRAISDEVTVGSTVASTNASKGYSGWSDQKTYITVTQTEYGYAYATSDINQAAAAFAKGYKDIFNESNDNRSVLLQFSSDEFVTTSAGELSYVVVKCNTSDYTDRIGYYYYTGEGDVKTLHKYVISNDFSGALYTTDWSNYVDGVQTPIFKFKQFKLVYFDDNGNMSYTFPAGLKVGFFCETSKLLGEAAELYSTGSLNGDISQAIAVKANDESWTNDNNATSSHVAIYANNGLNYVGFEDWRDFDYNDILLSVVGNVVPSRDFEEEVETDPVKEQGRIFCEDLGTIGDFDFNDVVFDAKIHESGKIEIEVLAAGGTLPISVAGVAITMGQMKNTGLGTADHQFISIDATTAKDNSWTSLIAIPVVVSQTEGAIELTADQGQAPQKFCAPVGTKWVVEYVNIKKAYDTFAGWVAGGTMDWTRYNPLYVYLDLSNND